MAEAQSRGLDVTQYLCGPSTQTPSSEAIQALTLVADLLNENGPDEEVMDGHCSHCTLTHDGALPSPVWIDTQIAYVLATVYRPYNAGIIHKAQSPPTGSRGPPILT